MLENFVADKREKVSASHELSVVHLLFRLRDDREILSGRFRCEPSHIPAASTG